MKKILVSFLALVIILSSMIGVAESEQGKKEILFRGIPWRSRYTYVKSQLSDLRLFDFRGETVHPYKFGDILLDQWDGDVHFEYTDINIFAYATKQTTVAGYPTSNIFLHFVFIPEDGVPSHDENRAAFYGATYEFELEDVDAAFTDLKRKLDKVYGERTNPEISYKKKGFWGYDVEFVYWIIDDAACSLGKKHSLSASNKDVVWISYVNYKADDYLQMASDAEKNAQRNTEKDAAGSGDTSGL